MASPLPNITYSMPVSSQKYSPSSDDSLQLDENDELDLSNKGLRKLNLRHRSVYQKAIAVNLSQNAFATIDGMIEFKNCTKLDASLNKLSRLTCFLPLREKLKYLNVSHNQLVSVDHLEKFSALTHLDVSHNKLETFIYVYRPINLVYLNLAYNHLKFLPKIDKLLNLEELDLRGNQLRSLENLATNIPLKLRRLDIGENLINDLTEAQYLAQFTELEALNFSGNPCVKDEGRAFSYRPFLYACILSELKVIDGFALTDEEVIKGEELHAKGRARSFRPGTSAHIALCEFLTRECPSDATGKLRTENDERLRKIIQKRREYLTNSEDDTSLSVSIPLRTPPSQRSTPMSYKSPYTSPIGKRSLRPTPEQRPLQFSDSPKSRLSTNTDEESQSSELSSSTVVLSRVDTTEPIEEPDSNSPASKWATPSPRLDDTRSSTPMVHEVVEESYLESIPEAPQEELFSSLKSPLVTPPRSSITSPIPTLSRRSRETVSDRLILAKPSTSALDEQHEQAAIKIQSWWRGSRIRAAYREPLLKTSIAANRVRIETLQRQLDKVIEENERLTTINEQQLSAINTMADQIKEVQESIAKLTVLQQALTHLVPTPVALTYHRDLKTDSLVLAWENTIPLLSMLKGYKLFADNEAIGEVVASNKRARITDLEPDKEHTVAIQAISSLGLLSAISEIKIPKLDSEDKENKRRSSPDHSQK